MERLALLSGRAIVVVKVQKVASFSMPVETSGTALVTLWAFVVCGQADVFNNDG